MTTEQKETENKTDFVNMRISGSINEILNEKLNNSNAKVTENLFNRWLQKKNNVSTDNLKIAVSVNSIKKALYTESALQIIETNKL